MSIKLLSGKCETCKIGEGWEDWNLVMYFSLIRKIIEINNWGRININVRGCGSKKSWNKNHCIIII